MANEIGKVLMHELYQELIKCGNGAIVDAAMKCESVFLHHNKALVSLSGGQTQISYLTFAKE